MTFRLLGPDGVRARMQELQAKVYPEGDFQNQLAGAQAAIGGLSGEIAPFSPLAPGVSVVGSGGPNPFRALIKHAAQSNGVNEHLFDALVQAESSYNPLAKSEAGAMGLSQLMPGTAEAMGVKNPFDPAQNLAGGAKYLSSLIERFGSAELALAAYNAGPTAVVNAGGIPQNGQTPAYVARVMKLFRDRTGQ